ncbi:response regulator transcription factor [Marinoscillum sp. MHG1-6]|uniref:response regulator transcription factor n=1 Tax=Marinoscillum sp. MHG1-6 TaxID=2959627 RepID=UPI0021575954|nr:response regulator transcription factor [Marinoscillum sp. MHG1-6]
MDINNYDKVFETVRDIEKNVVKTHINRLEELDKLMPANPVFFCITNTTKHSFEYVSKNFHHATGLDPKKMKEEGMNYWWSRFHPEEADLWVNILGELMQFTMGKVPFEDRKRVSYIWNYSIKNVNGEYMNITQHTTPMYFDDQGKPVIGLAHYTVTGKGERLPLKATAMILNANDIYETIFHKNFSKEQAEQNLSNREIDVLRLVAEGLNNQEVANKLYISLHTVQTHRRNIMAKSNCNNVTELIAKYIREGVL